MHFFVPRLVDLSMVFQDNLGILYVRLVSLGPSVLRPVLVVTLRGVLASQSGHFRGPQPASQSGHFRGPQPASQSGGPQPASQSGGPQPASQSGLCGTHLCAARLKKLTSTRVSIRSGKKCRPGRRQPLPVLYSILRASLPTQAPRLKHAPRKACPTKAVYVPRPGLVIMPKDLGTFTYWSESIGVFGEN